VKKLKAAIIGTGGISKAHLDNITHMAEKVELVCGCDINAGNLDQKALQYGFRKYSDYEDMLKAEQVDFVILATPQMVRKGPIEFCVGRKIPVFTEKPPASDLKTAREIYDIIKTSKTVVSVAFLFRYNPIVKKTFELLKGRQMLLLDIQYLCPMMYPENRGRDFFYSKELSGGLIMDQAIHFLDLIRYVLNDEITQVHAFGANLMQKKTRENTTEESVVMNMRSGKGTLISYLHTWTHKKWELSMDIFAPHAKINLDLAANSLKGLLNEVDISCSPPLKHNSPYFYELEEFVNYLRDGTGTILSPYEDSVKTMALADAVLRSIDSGETVEL